MTQDNDAVDVVMVGGGNMGAALLAGMQGGSDAGPGSMAVVERLAARREQLAEMFPGMAVLDQVPPCRAAVVAVKPDGVVDAVRQAVGAGATRILSIAAGVTVAALEDAAGSGVAVVRSMPNTPALVGEGMSAIAGGASASESDLEWAEGVLSSVGLVERLDEAMLDAFTGVVGSGPAYVFRFAEALIAAAVGEGFAPAAAERVVTQLLRGSATLLDQQGDPRQLRINVTSPGGTTAAGLAQFEAHDLDEIVKNVVEAATQRSRELA